MSPPSPTDAELIVASTRDPERFGELFERHFDAVLRYLRRRVDAGSAEEIAAEVFVEAFRVRVRYDASRVSARPWLFGIATNLLRTTLRSNARRDDAYVRLAHEDPSGVAGLASDRRRPDVVAAARALPDALREVVFLHAWADLDTQEIADALQIGAGAVRTRLSRARTRLASELDPEGAARWTSSSC